jgi:hypothetical protein
MQYVPESRKGEDVPCHHIPLDQEGRTIATLDATEAEEVLKRWLRHEISMLVRVRDPSGARMGTLKPRAIATGVTECQTRAERTNWDHTLSVCGRSSGSWRR